MSFERYQRHSLVDWFSQQKVSSSNILVVGAGAIGNEVLKNLCLLGLGHVHIIDFDVIEEHNLTRSVLFRASDVGLAKAAVAAKACAELDPNVAVTFSVSDVWQSLSFKELRTYDAVLCCVDNLEARIRLNTLCLLAKVDLYNAGIDSRNVVVEAFPFGTAPDCGCYECGLPATAYETLRKRYSCAWLKRVAFEEKKVPTTAITSSIAGACLNSLFLQRRSEHPGRITDSAKLFFDTITFASTMATINRAEDCPGCSRLSRRAHLFTAKRAGSNLMQPTAIEDLVIYLSEPIIIDGQCKRCNHRTEIFDISSKFDESLVLCPTCMTSSVMLRIVDSLPASELIEIFSIRPLAVKFIFFTVNDEQIVLELED